jgi:CTP synthase
MARVLMIDDDEDVAATVKEAALKAIPGLTFECETDFEKGFSRIKDEEPDVVILDWYLDPPRDKTPGQPVWEKIWKDNFCPVVIFTARPPAFEPALPESHPFVKVFTKGRGTEQKVVQCIADFVPHVNAMRRVRTELDGILRAVLKDTAPFVLRGTADPAKQPDVLARTARRRVAAVMDEAELTGGPILDWERYVVPPIGREPCVGDVLRRIGDDSGEPTAYCLVLTPSCDMVSGRTKVSRALVAKCCDCGMFVTQGLDLQTTKEKTVRERLKSSLTQAQCRGYVSLPELPGIIPHLSLNLRDLDLIELGQIANEAGADTKYQRIASIDSPFREQIVWAFLEISGRPGMPDRDFTGTIEGIVADLSRVKK